MSEEHSQEPEHLRARFERLYVPAVSDVLDRGGYRYQAAELGLVPLDPGQVIAGPAFTIVGGRPQHLERSPSIGLKVIERITAGVVACYDTQGNRDAAAWGEFWTSSTSARGCVGAVIDGGIRDSVRMARAGFPAFYRFRTPVDARGRMRVVDAQTPVTISGVRVHPGDYVFGDADGIVFIPGDTVLDVLAEAEGLVGEEARMRPRLAGGESPQSVVDDFGHF